MNAHIAGKRFGGGDIILALYLVMVKEKEDFKFLFGFMQKTYKGEKAYIYE